MFRNGKDVYETLQLLIRIPFVLILITLGFLFEFIINLPLMVICELDTRLRKKF
jgi:hypothetical protein